MNEVKLTFTIDLAPFGAGIKTMLGMVQDAGRQIQPLLNFQVKAPDFSKIDESLKKYEAELSKVKEEGTAAATASELAGSSLERVGKKADGSTPELEKHAQKMNKVKREAMEMFGGISFAAQGIVQLASSATGGSEKLDKLSTGMSQGISAGFGLASVITLVNPLLGTTAVIIGGVVAAGITLLNFFRDGKKEAGELTTNFEGLNKALADARTADIKEAQERNKANIDAAQKQLELKKKELEAVKNAPVIDEKIHIGANAVDAQGFVTDKKRVKEVEQEVENLNKQIAMLYKTGTTLNQATFTKQISASAILKETINDEIAAINDKYDRMAERAKQDWQDKLEGIRTSAATDQQKWARIKAGEKALQTQLTEIYDQQESEYVQAKKQEEAAEEQKRQRVERLTFETQKFVIDSEKEKELSAAKTNVERVRIEADYALRVMKIQENLDLAIAQSDEEKFKIAEKYSALRLDIEAQRKAKNIKATKDDQEESRKQWIETHRVVMGVIDGVRAAGESFWNEFIIGQRQAADAWDAIWLGFRNTALQRLGEILTDKITEKLIDTFSDSLFGTGTGKQGDKFGGAIIGSIGMAFGGPIGAGIGSLLGSILGFADGGPIRKPTLAIAGETGRTEFFAPEETFINYARNELEPKILSNRVQQIAARVNGDSNGEIKTLSSQIRSLRIAIDDMPTNVKLEQKGDDLFGVWKTADRNRRNSAL